MKTNIHTKERKYKTTESNIGEILPISLNDAFLLSHTYKRRKKSYLGAWYTLNQFENMKIKKQTCKSSDSIDRLVKNIKKSKKTKSEIQSAYNNINDLT